jgi:hypothetical protein
MAHPVLDLFDVEAFVQQVAAAGVFERVAVSQFGGPSGAGAVLFDEGVEGLAADGAAFAGRRRARRSAGGLKTGVITGPALTITMCSTSSR